MIVVDPVTLGDASLSGGGGTYWDKDGTLQAAAPGTPRLSYDPADLSLPAALLLETASTNSIRNNTMQGAAAGSPGALPTNWALALSGGLSSQVIAHGIAEGIDYIELRIFGTPSGSSSGIRPESSTLAIPAAVNEIWAYSIFLALTSGAFDGGTDVRLNSVFYDSSSNLLTSSSESTDRNTISAKMSRYSHVATASHVSTAGVRPQVLFTHTAGVAVDFTLRVGLPQMERDRITSPIKTTNAAVTRAADVVGTTAGLLYSNVPEPEPLWVAGTYALGAKVRDAAHVAWESLIDGNTAALPSKTDANWLRLGATNRHAMFDDRNNTQTTNAEEIVVALSPQAIAQGLFIGNADATEIGIAVTVPNFGVVYRETSSLVVSTSNSSFFRWGFNRIRRKNSFLSLKLPIFFNGVVTVTIRRPGGVAKCGMCMIGPTVEPGPALMGLSTEIKDYSTTSFNVDGSSSTIERGYRKLMSMDVSIATENIEQAEDQMIAWKQKTVVWIGAASRPDSIICGRYSSFKKVIESYPRSKMALQIEGVLS